MKTIANTFEGARSVNEGNLVELTSERWTTKSSATTQAKHLVEKEGGEPCLIVDEAKSSRSNRKVKTYIGGRIISRPEKEGNHDS